RDLGVAIIVIQHLDPKHGSLSTEILARATPLPVLEAQSNAKVQPGHIYVIPPNRNLSITKGILQLSERSEVRGQHMPIDFFFRSLAYDQKSRAIGIVL